MPRLVCLGSTKEASVAGVECFGGVGVAEVQGTFVDPGVDFGFYPKCAVKLGGF